VVQFEKTIRIRTHLLGVPQPVETPTRLSCGGSRRLVIRVLRCGRVLVDLLLEHDSVLVHLENKQEEFEIVTIVSWLALYRLPGILPAAGKGLFWGQCTSAESSTRSDGPVMMWCGITRCRFRRPFLIILFSPHFLP
jgi:hypothetical protein